MKFYVTNIDWDIDDFDYDEEDELNLPSETMVECEDEDFIADALSDEYGFCVNSFTIS